LANIHVGYNAKYQDQNCFKLILKSRWFRPGRWTHYCYFWPSYDLQVSCTFEIRNM